MHVAFSLVAKLCLDFVITSYAGNMTTSCACEAHLSRMCLRESGPLRFRGISVQSIVGDHESRAAGWGVQVDDAVYRKQSGTNEVCR